MTISASYYVDFDFGDFFYGIQHPMKPIRLNILHDLIFSYGLQNYLEIKYPKKPSKTEFNIFHAKTHVTRILGGKRSSEIEKHRQSDYFSSKNSNQDCPIFIGVGEYCRISSGGSISAAIDLVKKKKKIAINWAGGFHHAKKKESSGFCYTNDIVLAILELLKVFKKVLYIDIDVHHGDGVEEAFYLSNRVFCISFHKYGTSFFPGTGERRNLGLSTGAKSTINVPLNNGIEDSSFRYIFEPIVSEIIKNFIPSVIVLQAGADSLSGDKLGPFNISLFGHSNCIEFIKKFEIPLLVLGGGGYTKTNVVRCWVLETSLLIEKKISNFLPYNNFWRYFSPSFKLNFHIENLRNKNSKKNLKILKKKILQNVKKIKKI